MPKCQIRQATTNTERQETYRRSVKEGFYFEALMIAYAMQEDRLKSLLYYAGIFDNRNTIKVSKKTEKDLRFLLRKRYGEKERLVLTTITGKIKLLESLLFWSETAIETDCECNEYLISVKRMFEGVDIAALRETLSCLQKWLEYRNEVIHASMNKNITELYDVLQDKVETGMGLARSIDAQVKIIKKQNNVRKELKMSKQ